MQQRIIDWSETYPIKIGDKISYDNETFQYQTWGACIKEKKKEKWKEKEYELKRAKDKKAYFNAA